MYIQPDVIYSHLLIDQYNGLESCIHIGVDDIDIVKRSYIEGETSEEIYTWHSDEKMKRIEAHRDALLKALKLAVRQNEHDMMMTGEELRQCRAAIEAMES